MEQHDQDPTTQTPSDPWEEFSAHLSSLGEHLKEIYRVTAANGGPSDEEVKEALSTLAGAWEHVAETASVALRDEGTRDHLKKTTSSLAAALGKTLSQFGDEFDLFDEEE